MTSERRAWFIVIANTIAAASAAGAGMLPRPWSIGCVIVAAASSTFSSGLAKAPREGKLSDAADPAPTSVTSETETTKKVRTESDQEEHV